MENLKELIKEKIENCTHDMLRIRNEFNSIREKCKNNKYIDTDVYDRYNDLLKTYYRLMGELEAYTDCLSLLKMKIMIINE